MSAGEHLSPNQFSRTLHRGLNVIVPTSEIQPHLDRGDHQAAADAVLNHVWNYQETRPSENAQGRYTGVGVHWTDNRSRPDRFAGTGNRRDVDAEGDTISVPVVLRGVVQPEAIDHSPPEHRAVWDHSVENEIHIHSGAPISLRSAHVRLPANIPAVEEVAPGWSIGDSTSTNVVKRRMNRTTQA